MSYLRSFVLGLGVMVCPMLQADEGMWLLPMLEKLNISTMHDMGCELTADEIYNDEGESLRDAVVIFGGGCTGEVVSEKGLIFTNHHCGYGAIQQLSSVEHNYLRDGFWAKSHEEELPVSGLSVKFLRKMEDVTCQMLDSITDDMNENERLDRLGRNMENVIIEYSADNDYQVDVEVFYSGNVFYVVAYESFTDVRLVGTPPESIGKFGHDTDNWMWPRHTGDFSIFRVYTDKNGKPASYSADNIPMHTKKYFPISLNGYKPNDFAMIMGFPGSTDRYLTSWGVKSRMNTMNDALINVRDVKQKIWLEDMQADEKVNIQYASKYSSSSNYWKNSIGMNRGLKRLNIVGKKEVEERVFAEWVEETDQRKARYASILPDMKRLYEQIDFYGKYYWYYVESFVRGVEIYRFAYAFNTLEEVKPGSEEFDKAVERLKDRVDRFYKNYNPSTDCKVLSAMLDYYYNKQKMDKYSFLSDKVKAKYASGYAEYAKRLFEKSMFADRERIDSFLENPQVARLKKDVVYVDAVNMMKTLVEISEDGESAEVELGAVIRLYEKALLEMDEGKTAYPDANFTMRMTYGKVGGYKPADAVEYNYFTTMEGIFEKEDSTNWEFVVSPKLKELYAKKDYGRYADEDGTMHVCFLSNNDITGGNSGSPVIDGKGRLLGLAFDGNWEAMSGDIVFEPELQRCINVDIRYVLFVIEKYGEAHNIIEELKIE